MNLLATLILSGCNGDGIDPDARYAYANRCTTVHTSRGALVAVGEGYAFATSGLPATFTLTAADLGTYLLYDQDEGYLVASADEGLLRQTVLVSDATEVDDTYVSGAEWDLTVDPKCADRVALLNRRTGLYLGKDGLMSAADGKSPPHVDLEVASGCAEPPELSLDAEGSVQRTTFDDGDLYGVADTHAHLMSNWGFGGGGIFHGAPFHRLGVAHALGDCDRSHGEAGRKDFIGFSFDLGGADDVDITSVLGGLVAGELADDQHATAGYPDFTEWPDAVRRSTHQTEYHRWIERAYLGGLRLIVQHATTNAVLCHLSAGSADLPLRYPCDDMVAVDRSIDEVYAMERYLDAQAGGPGAGWFRVVGSPAEARGVIRAGKLAVILGIEASDLFDCRLTPQEGGPVCDEAHVRAQLDAYHARGVRALFPVHKYDNLFSAGDGDRSVIEIGNFLNSGHYSNFVEADCPDIPTVFDEGPVVFGGLNQPRADYLSEAPNDVSSLADDPIGTALPYVGLLTAPALEGDFCQQGGLTDLGEYLLEQMMQRGMIVEIDHLPRRSYDRAFALLQANDYPAAATHGNTFEGRIYEIGGVSKTSIGRCRDPEVPGQMLASLRSRLALIEAAGGYPAEGLGFDLNGFAGARGPRFEAGACADPQTDPTTYPFSSWAGDVTFTAPFVGNRRIDFDQEGFVHIGMLPELLWDAQRDAASDDDLEPLFRSAEAYVRMWERAEARGGALRGG